MSRISRVIIVISVVLLLMYYFGFALPFRGIPFNHKRHGNPPLTPAWALECWLWEDDDNTAARVDTLLEGYARNDIPVRTILIDSPWSTRYNDFNVDTARYPDPEKWFKRLEDDGYRVVLWMTSIVNSHSDDTRFRESSGWLNEVKSKHYIAGKEIKWWKGKGGFIDYTNPEAMTWWRELQSHVLSYGIDGWKLDGTGTLFRGMPGPLPLFYGSSSKGLITTRQYMDLYYRTEYFNGLEMNPDFVTLSRSVDRWYHPEGFAPIDVAPVTWVGDQEHIWESSDGNPGIEAAISSILKAADLGYNVVGSDIAGFSGEKIPEDLYIRWAQFSAFCGLFLNGGHGERALWKRTRQEMEIIRKFSWLHTELIPYIYTYVVEGNRGGKLLQIPLGKEYEYFFGDYFLVAPFYCEGSRRKVTLPEGIWRYFFNDNEIIYGPSVIEREFPDSEFPVFIKEGAIVPMDIKRDYTGLGNRSSEGFITFLIYPYGKSSFTMYHPDGSGSTGIDVNDSVEKTDISVHGTAKRYILRINYDKKPSGILIGGEYLHENGGWDYSEDSRKLTIRISDNPSGEIRILR